MNARMVSFLALILILAAAFPCLGEDADLARLFSGRRVTGTIVITNLEGTKTYVHKQGRANTPFVPASTFKIPNTLIALDRGVITENEELRWDGKDKGVAAWNQDQTIGTAFKASCVWFYQELARRLGSATYEAYLRQMGYGNARPTPELTTFWLEGDLRISAMEQIVFLKRLYRREFPCKPAAYETLQRIMTVKKGPSHTLLAKSGWAQRIFPQIGWYVGYVERNDTAWFFALNMIIARPEEARYRQEIAMEALTMKGILD